jgi:plasmid stabilization system protein ParE
MKILWTREAFVQLTAIEDFIAKDNAERAAKFVDEIIAHAESSCPVNLYRKNGAGD